MLTSGCRFLSVATAVYPTFHPVTAVFSNLALISLFYHDNQKHLIYLLSSQAHIAPVDAPQIRAEISWVVAERKLENPNSIQRESGFLRVRHMSDVDDFEDDDSYTDDIAEIELNILNRKKLLAKKRVDIRRLIEEREELKLLKEEIGLYADDGRGLESSPYH
ncbi:MAG: hypothetical protein ISP88_15475 [Pseudomonadales bacterium]|nr:hypothetical protein [Pseudomonadales bacterium]